jgi:hypothetical protein
LNVDAHALIVRFYRAFARREAATMASCYHAEATFRDPVFELRGADIGRMWTMLCSRAADLRVEYANVDAPDVTPATAAAPAARCDWQAWYTFSATGRAVHNVIHADFRLRDGLIVEHVDTFDFWRWSRQALGPAGLLLGWSPMLKAKVQKQAAESLAKFKG